MSTIVYFNCDDCAVEESRVKTRGGRVQKAKVPIGENGFISLAIDTEGNKFGLHSMRKKFPNCTAQVEWQAR